jgi:1,4-alpha-glucan branching enzyme
VKDLNRFYAKEPALFELDFSHDGFQWIDFHDSENSVLTFLRRGKSTDDVILVVCNFTPVSRTNYRVGVPRGGTWTEALNSDATLYAGSGHGNLGAVEASPVAAHGFFHSLSLTVPPLSALFFINKKEKGIS